MKSCSAVWKLAALLLPLAIAFAPSLSPARVPSALTMSSSSTSTTRTRKSSALSAGKKPQRLAENVDGVVYVNDRCINCQACAAFAPETFRRNDIILKHAVHHQPESEAEIGKARAALAACPVAAIRVETLAERRHRAPTSQEKKAVEESWKEADEQLVQQMSSSQEKRPFPRPLLLDDNVEPLQDVYWTGHHNEASFGAVPFLVKVRHEGEDSVWIMVDTPKYSKAAVDDVISVTGEQGPQYLFLTHVDDTADHGKWVARFPDMHEIFHTGDLGRHNWIGDRTLEDVDILLPVVSAEDSSGSLTAYSLNGQVLPRDWREQWEAGSILKDSNVVILHTPGHSPGSITLYKRPNNDEGSPGIIFTGDTYAYTYREGGKMTGFGRYGNNLEQQAETLGKLLELDWDIVAAGHGISRDYRGQSFAVKAAELKVAQEDLVPRLSRTR